MAVGLVVYLVGYLCLVTLVLGGLCRAAREMPRPLAEPAPPVEDPLDAELTQLLKEADRDAVLNAIRCDCPDCTLRREARRGRTTS